MKSPLEPVERGLDYHPPLCPACKHRLNHGIRTNKGVVTHVLYCGHGPCPSIDSNEPAEGPTLEAAMKLLTERVNRELDAKRADD